MNGGAVPKSSSDRKSNNYTNSTYRGTDSTTEFKTNSSSSATNKTSKSNHNRDTSTTGDDGSTMLNMLSLSTDQTKIYPTTNSTSIIPSRSTDFSSGSNDHKSQGSAFVEQRRYSQDNLLGGKNSSSKSSTNHDSRSSTPSSNSGTLNPKKSHFNNYENSLDDFNHITNTSPYFHTSNNGEFFSCDGLLFLFSIFIS